MDANRLGPPITRAQAIAGGLTFYVTLQPCRNGHTSKRYTSTGHCVECTRVRAEQLAATVRAARAAANTGEALLVYKLHPDDVAAALAACQALDMQRGRRASGNLAAGGPIPTQQVAGPIELPELIQRSRAQLEALAPPAVTHTPGEFARYDHPTNGS